MYASINGLYITEAQSLFTYVYAPWKYREEDATATSTARVAGFLNAGVSHVNVALESPEL